MAMLSIKGLMLQTNLQKSLGGHEQQTYGQITRGNAPKSHHRADLLGMALGCRPAVTSASCTQTYPNCYQHHFPVSSWAAAATATPRIFCGLCISECSHPWQVCLMADPKSAPKLQGGHESKYLTCEASALGGRFTGLLGKQSKISKERRDARSDAGQPKQREVTVMINTCF